MFQSRLRSPKVELPYIRGRRPWSHQQGPLPGVPRMPASQHKREQQDEEHLHARIVGVQFESCQEESNRQAEQVGRNAADLHACQYMKSSLQCKVLFAKTGLLIGRRI